MITWAICWIINKQKISSEEVLVLAMVADISIVAFICVSFGK